MHLAAPSGSKTIQVQENQNLTITLEDFEDGNRSFHLIVEMVGENAECEVIGRAQSKGKDQKVWKIEQIYQGHNQTGHIQLRGTAEDEAFLEFDGGAILDQNSTQSDAEVTEKIILFDQAKGRALPILTVKTDNVKAAGHGASIAPINDELILYFQSRGIPKKQAEKLIKEGFLQMVEDPDSSNRR